MTNKSKDKQAQGLIDFGTNTVRWKWLSVSLRQKNAKAAIEIFNKKGRLFSDRCPHPVYFNTPLLFIYMSGIEALICHGEIEFNRVYFLRFCTKYHT